jgi:hypothetical protein
VPLKWDCARNCARLCLLHQFPVFFVEAGYSPHGFFKVFLVSDVVAVENRPRLVAADLHGYLL